MGNYTKQDIIRLVEEEDVGFIRLQFVDSFGGLKNVAMTSDHLDQILNNRCMFDGAAIQGYDTKESVSYTHLDVYKRQDQYHPGKCG